MTVLLFQSFQWMSRVLQAVDDCVCVIISEFPVDESCAAGCGQHPPGRSVLPRPSTTKLPAQGTVRQQYTVTQTVVTYKQNVRNKYSTSHTYSHTNSIYIQTEGTQ